jgi:hypothetical protein
MKPIRTSLLLGAALAIASQAAFGYICRDEKGSTSYQEDPCPERKATSGVSPVQAAELNDKAMQETVKRLAKTTAARDSAAAISLMSRGISVTVHQPTGKPRVYDYPKYVAQIKNAYDGAQLAETYKCKPATASSPNHGALACDVTSEGMFGGRRLRNHDRKVIEFGLEAGEVKIVSIEVTNVSRSAEGRY